MVSGIYREGDTGPGGRGNAQIHGVIDIGTNSVRLLVARVTSTGLEPVLQAMRMPRLGQGVDRAKQLAPEAVERTLSALGALATAGRRAGARSMRVVGTSALRDAANRSQFLSRAEAEHGLTVAVLSGEEEAALSFYGAARGVADRRGDEAVQPFPGGSPSPSIVYVLDVGGGSTELAWGTTRGELQGRHSVNVGAVRMTELCITTDPPSAADWQCLQQKVASGLQPLRDRAIVRRSEPLVIAVGGTATTLAALDIGLPQYDPERVHGHRLSLDTVESLVAEMRRMTTAQRASLPAMQTSRADIIVAGASILLHGTRLMEARHVVVSEADLLHGVLWQQMGHTPGS